LLQVVSFLLALLVVGGCFFAVSAFTNHPTNSGNTVTTKNSGTPTSAGNASSCASSASVIIGTDFPSSEVGEDTAQKGADLAIKENHNLGQGYTLDACDKDDASGPLLHYDPAVGAQNMRQFANDPRVLGVVGPEDTDVALAEVPIAISAGLVMISPSVTNPCLTLQQDCSAQSVNLIHPSGKASTFFRIPGNDVKQGQADASLLYQSLGMSSVCVVDDQGTYGKGLADAFSENFKNYGGHILGGRFQMVKDEPQPQLADLAARIVALHPQAVFLGGSASNGPGFFKHQLALKGFNGPFVGGDGIGSDDQFIKDAGVDASNTYATSLGPDPSTLSPSFVKAYQKAYGEAPTSRSALGYDAAMILINAIQDALKTHAQNRRSTVLDNVQHPSQPYQGLTGTINFNSYGDNAGRKIFSVYVVEQGHWIYQPKYTVPVN
jgi:branched-chain amino acid transport system substrate-binding protein